MNSQLFQVVVSLLFVFTEFSDGKSILKAGSSSVSETQQASGNVAGFVNSTAHGNGKPGSAVAQAWQGGQTSASGSQIATADNTNSNAQSNGSANCIQGYSGSAGNADSTFADSSGNSLCNSTYSDSGTHSAEQKMKAKGVMSLPVPMLEMSNIQQQIGHGTGGQSHNSVSSSSGNGSPSGAVLNVFAGGWTNTPQSGYTLQQSNIDALGVPTLALNDANSEQNAHANEGTHIGTEGGFMNHFSGGLSSIYTLGASMNNGWNSHAPEEEESKKTRTVASP